MGNNLFFQRLKKKEKPNFGRIFTAFMTSVSTTTRILTN